MAKYLDDAALSELVTQIKSLVATKYTKPSSGIPATDLADGYVRYDTASQGLTTTQQANARTNIGAGTSNFDGLYSSLTGLPTLGTASSKDTGTTSGTIPLIGSNGKLDSSIIPTQQITIDSALSSTSENPVQNKVINSALSNKMDKANPTGTGALSMSRLTGSTVGANSATLGIDCSASGSASIAMGDGSTAAGNSSIAAGTQSVANNTHAVAIGYMAQAQGFRSIALGSSRSTNTDSVSIGSGTYASGIRSVAIGFQSTASGSDSFASCSNTVASGDSSSTMGLQTRAVRKSQFAFGEFNIEDTGSKATRGAYIEIVGNGTSDSTRSNARTLDWSGNEVLAGNLQAAGLTDGTTTKTMTEILAGSSLPSDLAYIDSTGTATTEATLLDDYYDKTEITSLLANKVDKITTASRVYGTDNNGAQTTYTIGTSANNIVKRTATSGNIIVPITPTATNHATSKSYVDNRLTTVTDLFSGNTSPNTNITLSQSLNNFKWVMFESCDQSNGGKIICCLPVSELPYHNENWHRIVMSSNAGWQSLYYVNDTTIHMATQSTNPAFDWLIVKGVK